MSIAALEYSVPDPASWRCSFSIPSTFTVLPQIGGHLLQIGPGADMVPRQLRNILGNPGTKLLNSPERKPSAIPRPEKTG
jgi:hypothetical protein